MVALEDVECLEGARDDHAPEIPENCRKSGISHQVSVGETGQRGPRVVDWRDHARARDRRWVEYRH